MKLKKYLIVILFIFLLITTSCTVREDGGLINFNFLNELLTIFNTTNYSTTGSHSTNSNPEVTYSGSSFTITQNVPVLITPNITGSITGCTVSPSLPSGLNIDPTTCVISGTPSSMQISTNYIITASNNSGSSSTTISIAINDSPPSGLSYTGSPYTFTQNVAISTITPTVTGTITNCSASPTLPAGLSINNSTCAISGTPTAGQTSTSYTITASNISGNTSTTINIIVDNSPPSSLTYSGGPYTFTQNSAITTITPSFSGTVTSCSASPGLPSGLSINNTTCAISGTPTVSQGSTGFTITASNSFGNTTANINITVNIPPPSALTYSGSPYTFTQNSTITTITPSVTGTVTSCGASPTLPTGLSLNNTTCAITGTPVMGLVATDFTITAGNSSGNTSASINISINFLTIYAATAGGLSISTNGGTNFTNYTTANGLGHVVAFDVFVVGSNVYVATFGGLSISTNGGTSYTNYTTLDGLGSNVVVRVYAEGTKVYAGTNNGLSISSDGGLSYTNYRTTNGLGSNGVTGVFSIGSNVYAGTNGGLSKSTNGGTSYTNSTTAIGLGSNVVFGVQVIGSNIYAATQNGLSISTNGGTNFTNYTTANGLGNNVVNRVYAVGSNVYGATNGGVSISTNGGTSYTNYTTVNGLGDNAVNAVYPVGSAIYVATNSGGLSISTNGGTSYTTYTTANGLGSDSVRGVYVK